MSRRLTNVASTATAFRKHLDMHNIHPRLRKPEVPKLEEKSRPNKLPLGFEYAVDAAPSDLVGVRIDGRDFGEDACQLQLPRAVEIQHGDNRDGRMHRYRVARLGYDFERHGDCCER